MPDPGDIAAIVLAAGRSRRFGADKLVQLMTLHGEVMPLAALSLRPWLAVFGKVTVVVRPEAVELRTSVEAAWGDGAAVITWVACAEADQGMGHSLAAGVGANLDAAGWMIGLADMPLLPRQAVAGVRDALAAGAPLAAAFRQGRRGHPVGFGAGYRDELLALTGDRGARGLLARDTGRITRIEIGHGGIFADIDSPNDINSLNQSEEYVS